MLHFVLTCCQPGIPLLDHTRAFITDGAQGAIATLATLFPGIPHLRDLRHVLANCRKIPPRIRGPDNAVAFWLSAEVAWTAFLPSLYLFDKVWAHIQLNNTIQGYHKLNHYVVKELLRWEETTSCV